jgi:hypothetical protein
MPAAMDFPTVLSATAFDTFSSDITAFFPTGKTKG